MDTISGTGWLLAVRRHDVDHFPPVSSIKVQRRNMFLFGWVMGAPVLAVPDLKYPVHSKLLVVLAVRIQQAGQKVFS